MLILQGELLGTIASALLLSPGRRSRLNVPVLAVL